MEIKNLFDPYSLKARVLPAVFTILIPLLVFNHFYTSPELTKLIGAFKGSEAISNISISFVLMFYIAQFARNIGKNLFEKKIFNDELNMPTTNFMLYSDRQFSDDYKIRFANKVKYDFNIVLSNSAEERTDKELARKRIVEAMSSVRKKLFKNSFLLQHNIEYGAMRNAIGGSVIGICICLINMFLFKFVRFTDFGFYASLIILLLYLILIIFSKSIIVNYGKAYAKILFREYLNE